MEQQFSLTWREFQGNLSSGCARLLGSGEFADVTLAAEGQFLQAHRLVLSICSPYFQRMFHANPCQHPIVVLKDISYNSMKDLLQFMYNGEVSVKQEDLTNLISTAETLEIKGLTNKLNNRENNNDEANDTISKNNGLFNDCVENTGRISNNSDECVQLPSAAHQFELLNQLTKLASLKRKCDNRMPDNYPSDKYDDNQAVQPDKRTKLREKQILNRHKISTNYLKNLPNNIFNNSKRKDVAPLSLITINASKNFTKEGVQNKLTEDAQSGSSAQKPSHSSNEQNLDLTIDLKKELVDTESDGAYEVSLGRNNDTNGDSENGFENHTLSPRIEEDGVNISLSDSPSAQMAPWPGSTRNIKGNNKGPVPYSEHKIITIPQKGDGKKKYPQKSCRYCWRAGRRRDTRFMCEQCCIPLCMLPIAADVESPLPTRFRYIYSRKGHRQLVHMNFLYTKHSTTNRKTSWRCVQYFSLNRCPATVETFGPSIYAVNHLHNHEDCFEKIVKNSIYEMEAAID